MADNTAKIVIDGEISPLKAKLREAGAALNKFGTDGEAMLGRMTGPLAALQSKFIAVGAILAGGAVFKAAVEQAANFTEESMKLGVALGISATEASTFITALADIDVSQEDFIGAAKAMTKELASNEAGLQAMGLKTRDAAGQLRPLNELTVEGIEIVKGYKEGTDRAIAGQEMFGKKFQLTGNLMQLNTKTLHENAELQKKLGLIVGTENVDAWKAHDNATDDANKVLKAVNVTIGNALMPALTDLNNWFVSIGPDAVKVIKVAFSSLVTVFHLVTASVTILWQTINAMVATVAAPIAALGEAIHRALQGDWEGAKAAVSGIGSTISAAWGKATDAMVTKAQSTRDRIKDLFADVTPSAAAGNGRKSANDLVKPPKSTANAKDKADPSLMGEYEARLAAAKNAYEQENSLRQYSKEQELAYWRDLQATRTLYHKDALAIAKRTATLELEVRRESTKQMRALDAVMVDSRKSAALDSIDKQSQAAAFALENGEITKLQLLELEEQFAARRFEIETKSLLDRQELLKNDPSSSPAALALLKEQELQVLRQYQMQKAQIGQDKKKEDGLGGMFDDVGQSFGNMARNLLTSATTLRQQLGQVFASIGSSFVNLVVSKPLADWIAGKAKMLAISLGFMAEEKAMQLPASIARIASAKTEAAAIIPAEAGIAAGAAASAVAGIPIVGPAMAAAAYGQTYAMVMAGMLVASAAKGFDIPKGLNPLTQLHEEEMVLPAVHANTIRRLGESGSGNTTAPAGDVHMHVHTQSTQDFQQFLKRNSHALAPALRRMARNQGAGSSA